MKNLSTIGRILFALPFVLFGLNHIVLYDWYIINITSFIPIGSYTVILTGLIMMAAGISMIIRKYVKTTALTLAGMLLVFILTVHIPNLMEDADTTLAMITMLKDVSLMGGALMIAGMKWKLSEQEKEE